jgi:hypothetical protein
MWWKRAEEMQHRLGVASTLWVLRSVCGMEQSLKVGISFGDSHNRMILLNEATLNPQKITLLSGEYGTNSTVKAIFWRWRSGSRPENRVFPFFWKADLHPSGQNCKERESVCVIRRE